MRYLMILTLLAELLVSEAYAAATDWQKQTEVSARLIAGNVAEVEGEEGRWFSLEFTLADGWKTYWRTPGDGGIAVTPDFSASTNVNNATIYWPAPKRYVDYDVIESYAYKHEVIIPFFVTMQDAGQPVLLRLPVRYAVCNEICLFLEQTFELDVPPSAQDDHMQARIDGALAHSPLFAATPGITFESIALENDSTTLIIKLLSDKEQFTEPDLFVEAGDNFRFPKPAVALSENGREASFTFTYETLLAGETLAGKTVTLTLADKDIVAETQLAVTEAQPSEATPEAPAATSGEAAPSLWLMVFFAFVGGLILNVMPCVLPVLSLKVIGFVKYGGYSPRVIRRGFLLSAAGIVSSFLLLAALVLGLKEAGTAVGWGFHFQEPLFVLGVILILNFFAANQFGLFEVRLPVWLGGKIQGSLDGKDNHSPMGHFLTGAFATLLATPCTAPFLGTAVSFALGSKAFHILLIFFVMGLGLAAPYLLFALFPKAVAALPKPGAWMEKVKKMLGLLLFATAIWLMWVLYHQVALPYSALLITLGALPAFLYTWSALPGRIKLFLLAITLMLIVVMPKPAAVSPHMEESLWTPFERAAINRHVSQGKVVFVDITADWCITCKFNKANVLYTKDILAKLQRENVIAMRGDYTQPVETITQFLREYNRYGIPFNIIYGPGAPQGIPLPELLSQKSVLEALERAK